MNMEKMKNWLKVMEVDFLETMHQNWLTLLRHVAIILIQLPIKLFYKWMHGFHVREKTNFSTMYFCFPAFYSFLHGKKNELGL